MGVYEYAAEQPVSRAATFLRQPFARQVLVAEAAWQLARARLSVVRRGQHAALAIVGRRGEPVGATNTAEAPALRDVGWAVTAAARSLPWNTECLTQAIAAARMLSRRGIPWVIHVGLARDPQENELIAHAWVACGKRVVVGGAEVNRYAHLVSYAAK